MTDPLLVETARRILTDTCDQAAVQAAEHEGFADAVWGKLAEAGLPWVSVPTDAGGSGGTLEDALELLRVAGAFAAPVPLAETSVLGGWLLASAGLPVPDGPVTVVPGSAADTAELSGGRLRGVAHRVPWARRADAIVAVLPDAGGWTVACVSRDEVDIEEMTNVAGEPRDAVAFRGTKPALLAPAADGVDREALRARGALSRVMLMAGALETIADMTVAYTRERRQFGRAVASFQAVQQLLVTCAEEAALVGIVAAELARSGERALRVPELAWAKVLANRAAVRATRAAHQAHGAIGMTQEYRLHHFTRRLWAWRAEYGGERAWARRAGSAVRDAGADALYPLIAGG